MLRRLGELLTGRTRAEDLVVRLGGEEFLVLSTCWPDSAEVFAERLRRTVESDLAPVTVSIGVYSSRPGLDDIWPEACWEMIADADQALYRAKADGRNRVVIHAGSRPTDSTGEVGPRTDRSVTAAAPASARSA